MEWEGSGLVIQHIHSILTDSLWFGRHLTTCPSPSSVPQALAVSCRDGLVLANRLMVSWLNRSYAGRVKDGPTRNCIDIQKRSMIACPPVACYCFCCVWETASACFHFVILDVASTGQFGITVRVWWCQIRGVGGFQRIDMCAAWGDERSFNSKLEVWLPRGFRNAPNPRGSAPVSPPVGDFACWSLPTDVIDAPSSMIRFEMTVILTFLLIIKYRGRMRRERRSQWPTPRRLSQDRKIL